ncbi:cytochrome Cbb3 oxidase maturation protein CcoH [Neptunitalea chrysea]|uniref:Cytochrome Cbb3 oxidase maturation protein CcoH n=1 Tax=Neptunitalea chrysea TaxID=1647581 RepID=A0A9W6B7X5_9FLAO|nr:FixH family protein [Neptunitalea chrysea]GLB53265.1 cytochrome Cbb3 oxidase maturation protein CcoH [Neptunitalea chrysea]
MKLKFNWGMGIVLAFVLFISYIMYFIITVSTDKSFDVEMVTEDYYKQELGYQKDINTLSLTKSMNMDVVFEKVDEGLLVQFPKKIKPGLVKGSMFLYRPSDKHMDFEIPISLSDSHLLIPNNRLKDGRWNITVKWDYINQSYLTKEQITF